MKHHYGSVNLTFRPTAIEIEASVERSVDDGATWVPCGSFRSSLNRTSNPDDVTGYLWEQLQHYGDFDATEGFIRDAVDAWVASSVYNA